jgi:RimJ/RimL family protein N-acetyltransferase
LPDGLAGKPRAAAGARHDLSAMLWARLDRRGAAKRDRMNAFPPLRATTRAGETVVVRTIAPSDADAVIALERAIVAARQGVVLTERDLEDEAALARTLVAAAYRDPRLGVRLVAEVAGHLAGSSAISRLRPGLLRHVASLSVGVHPRHQGRGVGRLLVERALAWTAGPGRADPPVSRVELSVRADNPRAIALYEALGFELEAIRRGYVRTPDGALVDDHVMVRFIPPLGAGAR